MTTIERNYRKNPHTARWLMTFHDAGGTNLGGGAVTEAARNEDLLDLVPVEAPAYQPTQRQKDFITDLINEIRELDTEAGVNAATWTRKMNDTQSWTKENVSDWIDRLIAKRKALRLIASATPIAPQGKPVAVPARVTEDGMYLKDGVVYKAQFAVNGSGRLYAKRLVPGEAGENATFEYAHGAISQLRPEHKMTLEQAKTYGRLYGTCVRCGRTLTDEFSIANGLGKVCITKF